MMSGLHQRLALCTSAVLLLHVAALMSLQGSRLARSALSGTPSPPAVQLRWIPAERAAASEPATQAPSPALAQAGVPSFLQARPVSAAPVPRASSAHGVDEADYLPRPLLSLPPVATAAIPIEYPPVEGDAGHYRAVLAVFVDETGRVRRVRPEGPVLPAPLEQAARMAFMNARFTPGEVDGAAVRSLIRVEVRFDHAATP